MKLYTRCKSCKGEISFLSSVNDRGELEMEKGKEFPMTCPHCLKKLKYHVNDFTAERSITHKLFLILIFIGLAIGIVLSEVVFLQYRVIFIGGGLLLPSIVYLLINKQQQAKLNSFNRFKVKQ